MRKLWNTNNAIETLPLDPSYVKLRTLCKYLECINVHRIPTKIKTSRLSKDMDTYIGLITKY